MLHDCAPIYYTFTNLGQEFFVTSKIRLSILSFEVYAASLNKSQLSWREGREGGRGGEREREKGRGRRGGREEVRERGNERGREEVREGERERGREGSAQQGVMHQSGRDKQHE